MTDEKLQAAKAIENRINELDAEIRILIDANGKRINPFKSFKLRGCIYSNYPEEKTITLTNHDIRLLQAVRSTELEDLRKLLNSL